VQMLQPAGGDLDADDLEAAYAYPIERTWLRLNFVSTLDGSVTDGKGHPEGLSSPSDQHVFALLRALSDVVLVGAGTARAEQYAPVRPTEVDQQLRARLGLAPLPPIAVVSCSLDVPEALLDAGPDRARTLVLTCASAPPERAEALADRAEVVPHLAHGLFAAGVLDELCLTMSPMVVAGQAPRLVRGALLEPPLRLRLGHVLAAGDDLLLRYVREGA
jgi:riboflavin biosynthesis pyrimidine reductase